jgi:hypothetical protein
LLSSQVRRLSQRCDLLVEVGLDVLVVPIQVVYFVFVVEIGPYLVPRNVVYCAVLRAVEFVHVAEGGATWIVVWAFLGTVRAVFLFDLQ